MRKNMVLLGICLFFAPFAWGAPVTWTGGTGNWETAGNWDTNLVPGSGDDVILDSGADVSVSVPPNAILSLTINSGGRLAQNGGTLTVSGDVTINDGKLSQNAGTLDVGGNFNAGVADAVVLGANVIVGGDFNIDGAPVTVTGSTLTLTGTGKQLTSNGHTLGTVTISTGASYALADALALSGALAVNGAGSFNQNGKTLGVDGNFSSAAASTLTLDAAVSVGGDCDIDGATVTATGSTLTLAGTGKQLTSHGKTLDAVTINTSASYTLSGPLSMSGTLAVNGTGSFNQNGETLVVGGDFSSATASTLTLDAAVTVGGNCDIDGATVTAAGSTLTLTGTNKQLTSHGKTLDAVTINTGTSYALADALTLSGALAINSNAILDIQGYTVSATGFTNNGTLRLEGSQTLSSPALDGTTTGTIEFYGTVPPGFAFSGLTNVNNVVFDGDFTFNIGPQSITAAGSITVKQFLRAGTLDITLTAATGFTIDGATITGGRVTLNNTASGGITQDPGSIIAAGTGLLVTGTYDAAISLAGTANDVTAFAANTSGADITLANNGSLAVGIGTDGITSANQNVTITTAGASGSMAVNQAINAGSGNVALTAATGFSMAAAGNITGGLVTLNNTTSGSITQTTGSSITANTGLLVTGTYDAAISLAGTANDVTAFAATTSGADITLANNGSLAVGIGTDGVTSANQNVTITTAGASGSMVVSQALDAGSGNVALTAAAGFSMAAAGDITGDLVTLNNTTSGSITQTIGSSITANTGLLVTGTYNAVISLIGDDNKVKVFAANPTTTAAITLVNNDSTNNLAIGTVNTVSGITSGGQDVTITEKAGSLTVNQPINAGSGNVTLTAATGFSIATGAPTAITGGLVTLDNTASGGIGQTTGSVITAGTGLLVTGNYTTPISLGEANSVKVFAANTTGTATEAITLVNNDSTLAIDTLTGPVPIGPVNGITSGGKAVTIESAGSMAVNQVINAGSSGNVALTAVTGFSMAADGDITGDLVTLNNTTSGGITQDPGSVIAAGTGLLVTGTYNAAISLIGDDNKVKVFATNPATATAITLVNNDSTLAIDTLTGPVPIGTVNGITSGGQAVTITEKAGRVTVGQALDAGNGNVTLTSKQGFFINDTITGNLVTLDNTATGTGGITQTAAITADTAGTGGLLVTGNYTTPISLGEANSVKVFAASTTGTATAAITLVNNDSTLAIDTLTGPGSIGIINGITSGGKAVTIESAGSMAVNQALDAGGGNVALTAVTGFSMAADGDITGGLVTLTNTTSGGITQVSGSAIEAGTGLLVTGTYNAAISLAGTANDVTAFAANTSGAAITLANNGILAVGIGTDGITSANQNVTITTAGVSGSMAVNQALDAGSGNVALTAAAGFSMTADGDITGGLVTLNNTTSGGIGQVSGSAIEAGTGLLVTGTYTTAISLIGDDNKVKVFAANPTTTAAITLVNNDSTDNLIIDTVNGVPGIASGGLGVTITEKAGSVTVSQAINAGSGNVTLTAETAGKNITTDATPVGDITGNPITLTADTMNLSGNLNAGTTGRVTIRNATGSPARTIYLDGSGGDINITPTNITAGILELGRADAQATGQITLAGSSFYATVNTLVLRTGAGITNNIGNTIAVPKLAIQAGTDVSIQAASATQNIAINTAGNITFESGSFGFIIDTYTDPVNGTITGLSCGAGKTITINASSAPSAVTQNARIATGSGGTLALNGAGPFILNNTSNAIQGSLTGTPSGAVDFFNTISFNIGTPGLTSSGSAPITLDSAGGSGTITVVSGATLNAGEKLVINASVDNSGTILAGTVAGLDPADNANIGQDWSDAASTGYAIEFMQDYTETATGLLQGKANMLIAFKAAVTLGARPDPSPLGWLVFIGAADQSFTSNYARLIPNVLIYHTPVSAIVRSRVIVSGSVHQKGNYLLVRQGALNVVDTAARWCMDTAGTSPEPPINPSPLDRGGFTGVSGILSLYYDSSGLTKGLQTGYLNLQGITLNNGPSGAPQGQVFIETSSNITVASAVDFTDLAQITDLKLSWNGDGSGSPSVIDAGQALGGLTLIDGSSGDLPLILGNNLTLKGDLYIGSNKILDVSSSNYTITMDGSLTGIIRWTQAPGPAVGSFEHRTGTVEFTGGGSPAVFEILGETTWHTLRCHEAGSTIKFSNYDPINPNNSSHHVRGTLDIKGTSESSRIVLTRLYGLVPVVPPSPPWPPLADAIPGPGMPPVPADYNKFWFFDLQPGASMDLEHVVIWCSWARPASIPLPEGNDVLADYANFYDYNWMSWMAFLYAFTEDTDGNGKIDRIRLQATVNLDYTGSWYSGLDVTIEGYEKTAAPGSGPNIYGPYEIQEQFLYVYVREKDYDDGGATPRIQVRNTSMLDAALNQYYPATTKQDGTLRWITATDTVAPRINYTLALPNTLNSSGKAEIFVQASEALRSVTVAGIGSPYSLPVAVRLTPGDREFFIDVDALPGFTLDDLAAGTRITITGEDNAVPPSTGHPSEITSPAMAPKYPGDWIESRIYFDYDYFDYDYTKLDFSPHDFPPPPPVRNGIRTLSGANPFPAPPLTLPTTHRITDLLISVPPASDSDNRYFVWPLWAKTDEDSSRSMTPSDDEFLILNALNPERGLVWRFDNNYDGLEHKDSTLQAKAGGSLTAPGLVFAVDVPEQYRADSRYGPVGLWLPPLPPPNSFFMTPGAPSVSSPGASSSPPVPPLYNYSFSASSNPDFKRGLLDFFFHFPSSPVDLYVARLNIKAGSGIPSDWYRRIKPFSFRVLDIVNQRGGATILNNVIDPSRGERTFLRYNLSRGGRVTIQVFTLDGNLVKVLQRGNQSSSGEAYTVEWNGRNEGGNIVARGMYFIRIVGPDIDEIRKVMVIR